MLDYTGSAEKKLMRRCRVPALGFDGDANGLETGDLRVDALLLAFCNQLVMLC